MQLFKLVVGKALAPALLYSR